MPQRHEATKKKSRRNKLLAMAHIAQKELDIPDEDVRTILKREFKKTSRADLSELELGYLIDYFHQHGWQTRNSQLATRNNQCAALRTRAYELAGQIENGETRLKGLAKKILGVDRLEWARDVKRLQRLLAILEKIKTSEGEAIWD